VNNARNILLVGLMIVAGDAAMAHDQIPGAAQQHPIVIRGGTIHVVDGPDIQNGDVLFDDGKIVAVGRDIQVPEDATTIDATDKHVYPGLIEPMTDLGLREISAVDETVDRIERGDRNPNVRSWIAINPDSELIPVARAGGVLLAMTSPSGNWIRGQAAVVQLDGWTPAEMTLKAPAGLCINWNAMHPRDEDPKKQAKKQAEKYTELEALFDEARRYGQARSSRPDQTPTDVRLESLLPVIEGRLPIIAEADRESVIESAVAFAQTNGLDLIIYGGYDAPQCAELLKRYDVPVIVAAVYRLPLRRHDPYDAAYTLPQRLQSAGVRFCIAGEGPGYPGGASNTRNLPYHAACAAAYGLPLGEALRSITLSAAEILGVDDRVGSITVDKDATLIIVDGDVLQTHSHVVTAYVQGREVDLGSRHKTLYEKYRQKYER
tara:strand:- start:98734 stop:100035 length:1302 start_codon:yes stop_codon:yes gene_type:complete